MGDAAGAAASLAPTSAFNLILGPMVLGNAFNCILFGFVIMQYVTYVTNFKDPRILRWIVGSVVLVDTVQTAVMIYMNWVYMVMHYGEPAFLATADWSIGVIPFFSVPISWVVQLFFAWRIYQLNNRNLILPVFVSFVSIVQGLAGIGCGIGAFWLADTALFYKLQPIAIVWFVGSILCDTIITIAMIYYLLGAKTGYKDTDQLLHRISKAVVETGLATTTVVIIDAIFFFRLSKTDMHLMPVMIAGKMYSNSLLYMLNSRRAYRKISRGGQSSNFRSFGDSYGPNSKSAGSGTLKVSGNTSSRAGSNVTGTRIVGTGGRKKHTLTEMVFERPRMMENGEWVVGDSDDEGEFGDTTAGSRSESMGMRDLENGKTRQTRSRSNTSNGGNLHPHTSSKPRGISVDGSFDDHLEVEVQVEKDTVVDEYQEHYAPDYGHNGGVLANLEYGRQPAVRIDEGQLRSPSKGHAI
ncbi:hypothetical protein DL93DRAFT_2087996 [Clavulina sp. PMI_390]|nr:hypothetical protein DL93DRAFT_2087996 [Clavulina sp. PMI_390]